MDRAKFDRLVAAAQALEELEGELRLERSAADGDGKALVRRVCANLERSRAELEKAIGAAALHL